MSSDNSRAGTAVMAAPVATEEKAGQAFGVFFCQEEIDNALAGNPQNVDCTISWTISSYVAACLINCQPPRGHESKAYLAVRALGHQIAKATKVMKGELTLDDSGIPVE